MSRSDRPGPDAPSDLEQAEMLAEIEEELAQERRSRRRAGERLTGGVLLAFGLLGWIASLALLVDKIYLLSHPGAQLSCDINPLISCGTIMETWQASAFGFPNMALGLTGFAVMGVVGALWLTGGEVPAWLRYAQLGGMVFAFGFIHFLAISAIFDIRALCPWCMVVWGASAPMLFVSLARAVESGDIPLVGPIAAVLRRWLMLTIAWYALVAVTIFFGFQSAWLQMLGVG